MSPSLNKLQESSPRLLLAGGDLANDHPANQTVSAYSSYARELLSELATQLGMHCPPALWSARGEGKPTHPGLHSGWYANITHKKGRVVVGLADRCFGIDLEYAAARRTARLDALIDQLPEPWVRQRIREADSRVSAFYQSWTLYESLFKHASHTPNPAENLFAMRLHTLAELRLDCAVWQGDQWTLAIVSEGRLSPHPDPATLFCGLQPTSVFILD